MKNERNKSAPLLASDIDDAWLSRVRYALAAGHHRVGVGQDASIQVTNRYGDYMPLLLPNGSIHFASVEQAQLVIDTIGTPQA